MSKFYEVPVYITVEAGSPSRAGDKVLNLTHSREFRELLGQYGLLNPAEVGEPYVTGPEDSVGLGEEE